ncbi:hypothetical protein ACT7DC_21970 [Bacillus cereus]
MNVTKDCIKKGIKDEGKNTNDIVIRVGHNNDGNVRYDRVGQFVS